MVSENSIRLFVDQPLDSGMSVELNPEQVNYVRNVMRLNVSDSVRLFNGKDGEWQGTIAELAKKSARLTVEKQTRKQKDGTDVWLLFAPIKFGKIDFLVTKATELGVSTLQPVITKHTIVTRVNTDRLRANAIEAAEQSDRLTVPEVSGEITFEKLIQGWDKNRQILLCDESGAGKSIGTVLSALPEAKKKARWAILIGPEGGFSKAELEKLRTLPYVTSVGLGENILRADTAALAALACFQSLTGRWETPPHFEGNR
ncbi:MAG: 16S rRNA (uracil(1498)-N(3))-methyltransferase [Proteobacteria bacterium]|nr:16S rRNA (uracil(1498)-N(3))-methyltransferase [Pseudomonadota bacterium]